MQMVQRFTTKLNEIAAVRFLVHPVGVALGTVVLCVLAGLGVGTATAYAASPWELYAGTAPVPLGDSSGRLVSQTISATVSEGEDGVWVSVDARFLIEGGDGAAGSPVTVSLPVELPGGYLFDPAELVEFTAAVDGQHRTLKPLQISAPDGTEPSTSAYTVALAARADGTASDVGLHYRQYLGDGPVATFRFATAQTSRWTGDVGSSRIVVELPQVTSLEQVLVAQPPDVTFDGQRVEWYYSDFEPSVDVMLTFVNPSLWQQIVQARIELTETGSSGRAHYDLALLYRQIVESEAGGGRGVEAWRDMMIAELAAALESPEALPVDASCEVRREMQGYYLEEMHRADGAIDTAYLLQAVDAFRQTEAMCPEDTMSPGTIVQIEDGYVYLARDARRQGRYEAALGYLESAEVLYRDRGGEGGEFLERIASERHLCFLTWTVDLLRQGDIRSAVEMAGRGGIGESALADWDAMPRVSAVQVSVQTGPGQRRILISLTPFPAALEGTARAPALDELVGAIAESGGGLFRPRLTVGDAGAYLIETVIPFKSGIQLRDAQSALAEALPDWPELAFARSVLAPVRVDLETEDGLFSQQETYDEMIDARESAQVIAGQLEMCERRLQDVDAARGEGNAESVEWELWLVRREVLTMARSGWERLAGSSRAVFSLSWVTLTGELIDRTWTVDAGRDLDMHLGSEAYDWKAIGMAVGLAIAGIVVIVLILFLLARIRR